jgi:hypothetical protein
MTSGSLRSWLCSLPGLGNDASTVAAFSDASVVDEDLQPLGYTMWEHVGFSAKRRKQMTQNDPWQPLFKDPVVTGATLMFRKRLVDACLPIPDSWIHDAWIAQIAAAHGRIVAVPEPLILYRQHSANVIGGKRLSLRSPAAKELRQIGRKGLGGARSFEIPAVAGSAISIGRDASPQDHAGALLLRSWNTLIDARTCPRIAFGVFRRYSLRS